MSSFVGSGRDNVTLSILNGTMTMKIIVMMMINIINIIIMIIKSSSASLTLGRSSLWITSCRRTLALKALTSLWSAWTRWTDNLLNYHYYAWRSTLGQPSDDDGDEDDDGDDFGEILTRPPCWGEPGASSGASRSITKLFSPKLSSFFIFNKPC